MFLITPERINNRGILISQESSPSAKKKKGAWGSRESEEKKKKNYASIENRGRGKSPALPMPSFRVQLFLGGAPPSARADPERFLFQPQCSGAIGEATDFSLCNELNLRVLRCRAEDGRAEEAAHPDSAQAPGRRWHRPCRHRQEATRGAAAPWPGDRRPAAADHAARRDLPRRPAA